MARRRRNEGKPKSAFGSEIDWKERLRQAPTGDELPEGVMHASFGLSAEGEGLAMGRVEELTRHIMTAAGNREGSPLEIDLRHASPATAELAAGIVGRCTLGKHTNKVKVRG